MKRVEIITESNQERVPAVNKRIDPEVVQEALPVAIPPHEPDKRVGRSMVYGTPRYQCECGAGLYGNEDSCPECEESITGWVEE